MAEEKGILQADRLHHILRIFLPKDYLEKRTADVLNYCRRTGCSEVLLITTSYDDAASFVSLDEIAKYTELLRPVAEQLRQAGITVSVNVLQTLGHVYFPAEMQDKFPFQRRVHADGAVSTSGACPLCPNLQEWVAVSYRMYAGLKPRILFVDDDYRTHMGGLTCFCNLHLQRMSKSAGREVSREEIIEALKGTNRPHSELRQVYREVTTQGLCELAEKIRLAVHAESPGTRVGLMTEILPIGAYGMDIAQILKTLAGGCRPLVRPQISMYSEGFLRDIPNAFLNPDRLRAVLPDDVEYYPEIENYQYTLFSKSARCTFVQMASQILMGFNHLALNVFDMYASPFSDNEQLIDLLEHRRCFLDSLHNLVPEGSRPAGIWIFVHPQNNLVHRVSPQAGNNCLEWMDLKEMAGRIPNLGLPVTHNGPSPWTFLSGDDVLGLSESRLNALLSRGAVMDAQAADALALRGQAERIGVKVEEPIELDNLGYEEFTRPCLNPERLGRCFPLRPLVKSGDWRRLRDLTGKGTAASRILNYKHRESGPGLLLTENNRGERFGVLAFSGQGNRHLVENAMRAEQLRQAFVWVAQRNLPLAIPETHPYLWPIINRTEDGRLLAGIINLSTDTYNSFPVIWGSDSPPGTIQLLDREGQFSQGIFDIQRNSLGEVILIIRRRLAPLDLVVLIFVDTANIFTKGN